ncbi:hypothetical protein [Fodinibius sp.]|uniref:hypothetical protein n=1 Tax=Fodinibius sp. TaxID=1872440 RepID=UPI002ACE10CD|nr:hypothetical protein [Fodinibius sp.]MDZ7658004.1 hypothetical protein [Fodinibius sp.]
MIEPSTVAFAPVSLSVEYLTVTGMKPAKRLNTLDRDKTAKNDLNGSKTAFIFGRSAAISECDMV